MILLLIFWVNQGWGSEQAVKPPEQPIAFNHKQHVRVGLECEVCHSTATQRARAGLPSVEDCLVCHQGAVKGHPELQELISYEQRKKSIPWVRIYELPYYVFFKHSDHLRALAKCETCHGHIAEREVLWKEKEISMEACIQCHEASGASEACNLCHELNR